MAVAITLHILAAVLWVGGMFFAYVALRPAAASLLEPPQRMPLWAQTFARFFPWVWAAVVVLPLTGYWLILYVFEGFANAGAHVHVMQLTGWAMILVFLHVYFAPYRRLREAVEAADWSAAAQHLGRIRRLVGFNLALGLVTVVVATGGRYLGEFFFAPS
ncbi:MAG TPA: CopD family protein [Burkholderiales bacterium]